MMKYIQAYALFLVFVFCTSCGGQNKPDPPKEKTRPGIKDTVTSQVPNSMVRNIKQARNGDILIASYKGVFRYDGKSFTNITSTISSPSFWDVLEDRKGNLWFATRDSGVYCYNGKFFQHFTTREGLAYNGVKSVCEDKTGNIWFGTAGGVSRYDGKSFRNFTTQEGLSNNDINIIIEDKAGKLWFGTRGGTCFYDGHLFTVFKNKDGKSFNNVWGITEDRKGNIWFGADGLWRYDGRVFTKASQKGAYAVIEDKKGNIWTTGAEDPPAGSVAPPIGNIWKVSRYSQKSLYNKKPIVTEIKLSGEQAFLGILEAKDGSIWFGSLGPNSGVYRYDGKKITDFKSAAGQK